MLTCANCDKKAEYTCADPGVNPVNYCAGCLPFWLQERALLGHFPLAVQEEPKSKKKTSTAAEEPADESN